MKRNDGRRALISSVECGKEELGLFEYVNASEELMLKAVSERERTTSEWKSRRRKESFFEQRLHGKYTNRKYRSKLSIYYQEHEFTNKLQ